MRSSAQSYLKSLLFPMLEPSVATSPVGCMMIMTLQPCYARCYCYYLFNSNRLLLSLAGTVSMLHESFPVDND
jgi:hypothetical protein